MHISVNYCLTLASIALDTLRYKELQPKQAGLVKQLPRRYQCRALPGPCLGEQRQWYFEVGWGVCQTGRTPSPSSGWDKGTSRIHGTKAPAVVGELPPMASKARAREAWTLSTALLRPFQRIKIKSECIRLSVRMS